MNSRWALIGLVVALLVPATAQAMVVKCGEDIEVPRGEVVHDNLYVAGQRVRIDGDVQGDLVVAGGEVVVTGTVRDGLLVTGGNVTLGGRVGRSVRVMGGTVRLEGPVERDVLALGGTLDLGQACRAPGGALLAGGEVTLKGDTGPVRAGAGTLRLKGRTPSVDAAVGKLVFSPDARIDGPLNYRASQPAAIPAGAVRGPISFEKTEHPEPRGLKFGFWLWCWLASIFSAVVLAALLPRAAESGTLMLRRQTVLSLLVGLGITLVFPGAVALLAVTVIGIPLAVLLGFVYPPVFFVGWLLSGVTLGAVVCDRLTRPKNARAARVMEALLGGTVLAMAAAIPWLGLVVWLVGGWMGLGAICLAFSRTQELTVRIDEQPAP